MFAAATASVNAVVVADARDRRILVCDSITPEAGDFTLPAVLRRGELSVAVSTGGTAPSLAKQFRDRIDTWIEFDYGEFVKLLGEIRKRVLQGGFSGEVRRRLLVGFADDVWLRRMRAIGPDRTLAEMAAVVADAERSV